MHRPAGRVAKLGAEVAPCRIELAHDRRGGAHADVDFLQDVVVNQRQLDVFVAAALSRFTVDLAEQVELGTLAVALGFLAEGRILGLGSSLCAQFGGRLRRAGFARFSAETLPGQCKPGHNGDSGRLPERGRNPDFGPHRNSDAPQFARGRSAGVRHGITHPSSQVLKY